jgi:CheY-like chemotaxis protein
MPLRLKILIAEDNPDCAHSLATLLRLRGHQRIHVVSDGASAVAATRSDEFDVVLLDLPRRCPGSRDSARNLLLVDHAQAEGCPEKAQVAAGETVGIPR